MLNANCVFPVLTKDFTITAATFTGVTVTLSNSAFTYDGTEKKPGVTVKAGSKLLSADKDYTIAYANNINAGTASVIITGKGSYSGSTAKSFTINPADLSKASITLSASSFIYDGTEKKPEVTISIGQKHLSEETDYTLSYKNNTISEPLLSLHPEPAIIQAPSPKLSTLPPLT